MQHSPPATRRNTDRLEAKLKGEMKNYRRMLQKISKIKTKILYALREEGVQEAAEMLMTPAKGELPARCQNCIGCHTLSTTGPCQKCQECLQGAECSEHTRQCLARKQPSSTFVDGSVVTGISSMCNVIDYDLTAYRNLVDKLGEASLDVEGVLDEFPMGSSQHLNDRYNASRRTCDAQVENEVLLIIEGLLIPVPRPTQATRRRAVRRRRDRRRCRGSTR